MSSLTQTQPVALADRYRFEAVATRSQRLPPRGLLRLIDTHVTREFNPRGPINHTLFFTSLLAAPVYQESIVTHWTIPAPGRHGPFNVSDLSPADYVAIPPAELVERGAVHLEYARLGCASITQPTREHVLEFLTSVAERDATLYRLSASDWFSAAGNRRHSHEWSHALLEFHEYLVVEPRAQRLLILMFAFD